jgi:hypothetical protein
MVQLATAGRETVGEAMTLAWQGTVKTAKTRTRTRKGRR